MNRNLARLLIKDTNDYKTRGYEVHVLYFGQRKVAVEEVGSVFPAEPNVIGCLISD